MRRGWPHRNSPVLSPALSCSVRIVIDTNVLFGAFHRRGGASRQVVLACLKGQHQPALSAALFAEYEDVFARQPLWKKSLLDEKARRNVLDAFLSVCSWTEVFFLWRPNLRDEGDNFIIETAVASGAVAIVTRDVKDLRSGELRFPDIAVLTPEEFLARYPCPS